MLLRVTRSAPSLLRATRPALASATLPRARFIPTIWPPAASKFLSSSTAAEEPLPKLIITEACAKRIVQLNVKKGVEDPALHRMLRLSVEPGGCSGFSYKFELEEHENIDDEEDTIIEHDSGARVVVDEGSLALLSGATIDFEDEMMKSAFIVTDNPMSSGGCGCGTSFQV